MKKDPELSWLRMATYCGGLASADELRAPFSLQMEGRTWSGAADTFRILAIKGGRGLPELSEQRQVLIRKRLGPMPENAPETSFSSLLDFVTANSVGRAALKSARCRIGEVRIDAMKLVGPLSRAQPPAGGVVRVHAPEADPRAALLIDCFEWRIALMGLDPKYVAFNVPKYELLTQAA